MFGLYDTYMKFFGLTITYYGFFFSLGIALGLLVAYKLAKLRGFKGEDFLVAACYIIPIAILGARLYYVIFSDQHYTFLQFFKIWEGGLAVYGGVIGGGIAIGLYCLIHKKNFLKMTDIIVVGLVLGQAIGRIGCYFGHCCYGIEVTNESMKWFPLSTKIGGVWHYSTFFYESFCCFIIFGVLLYLIIKKVKTTGIMTGLYCVLYGVIRCLIETLRGDSLYIGAMKVSQLLSVFVIIGGLIMILVAIDYKKNKESDLAFKQENSVIIPKENIVMESKDEYQENTNDKKENIDENSTEKTQEKSSEKKTKKRIKKQNNK